LPNLRGEVGSEERKQSTAEIDATLKQHDCDWDDIWAAGYFIPNEWREKDDKTIEFKNSNGVWEKVLKSWVIFEEENPQIFEIWDKEDKEEE
jgi:hypothetical protein